VLPPLIRPRQTPGSVIRLLSPGLRLERVRHFSTGSRQQQCDPDLFGRLRIITEQPTRLSPHPPQIFAGAPALVQQNGGYRQIVLNPTIPLDGLPVHQVTDAAFASP
jgi:hypothetical protein